MPHTYKYPRPAITADAVVFKKKRTPEVLLIRRAKEPFAGAWAIPGGFAEPGETMVEAAARELKEETGVDGVPLNFLGYFDALGRDPRERTIAFAFWGVLESDAQEAQAADDAAALQWHRIDRLPALAFDHADILSHAIAALRSRKRR